MIVPKLINFLRSQKGNHRFKLRIRDLWPCPFDATIETNFDRHYVYHPAWALRKVLAFAPKKHIDLSSTLHFCSMLSAHMPVEFYDYRPAKLELSNQSSSAQDILNLSFADNSLESVSCMHVVEHIGLGRYGDPIDYDGDLKAIKELARVIAPQGILLFVVPVGRESIIQFNAHRVYHPQAIIEEFNELGLILEEFCLIPESASDGGLVINPTSNLIDKQVYGCG